MYIPYYNDNAHTCTFLITTILHTRVQSLLQRYCTHVYIPYYNDTAHTCTPYIKMCIFYDAASSRDLFYIKVCFSRSEELLGWASGMRDRRQYRARGMNGQWDRQSAVLHYCTVYSLSENWRQGVNLTLCIVRAIALYAQIYCQLTAQYTLVFLKLLHISATNRSHLQGAAVASLRCLRK